MPERMLTTEELGVLPNLSAAVLYYAEVKRIEFLPREEQARYVEAARAGDAAAGNELLLNCLNWTLWRAYTICRDYPPNHADMMDLVSCATSTR